MKKLMYFLTLTVSVLIGFIIVPTVYAGEGHDAGYEWAAEHGIDDPDYDEGNSESFNEGVREYAEEQAEASEEDDEENE